MDAGENGVEYIGECLTVWVETKAGFRRETVCGVVYEFEKEPASPLVTEIRLSFIAYDDLFLGYLSTGEMIQLHFSDNDTDSDETGRPVESLVVVAGKIVSHELDERNKSLRRVVLSVVENWETSPK